MWGAGAATQTSSYSSFLLARKVKQVGTTIDWDDRPLSSVRGTKELVAEGPCTHRLPEFTSNLIQQNGPVDIIESTSLETKI